MNRSPEDGRRTVAARLVCEIAAVLSVDVVVAGLDVVRTIQQQPVQGQSLTPPIEIAKAYRLKPEGR